MLALPASSLKSATINVPADQPTIQAGIDGAVSGADEVVVAPGACFKAINFNGMAITLRSAGSNPSNTIINGLGHCRVARCTNGEGPDTVLEGFTLTGGNANGSSFPDDIGGGMYNINSSPTIKDCTFIGNSADKGGGQNIGFIAEEIAVVLPELVVWESDGKTAADLKYDRITTISIQNIQRTAATIPPIARGKRNPGRPVGSNGSKFRRIACA